MCEHVCMCMHVCTSVYARESRVLVQCKDANMKV